MRVAILILGLWTSLLAATDFVVIVHPDSSIKNISKSELERIFLSKTRSLPDGTRAQPVEVVSRDLKSHFYHYVADKSVVELRSYWATLIFTGLGKPPKQMQSRDALIEYVRTTPGAIAYVSNTDSDASVKIVPLNER